MKLGLPNVYIMDKDKTPICWIITFIGAVPA